MYTKTTTVQRNGENYMDIFTQQLIGSIVLLSSLSAMVYLLIDLKKEEKQKGDLSEAPVLAQPVYLKECHYIYPDAPKAKAV